MQSYHAELDRLESRAQTLPVHSEERVTTLGQAIALADRQGDARAGWWLRHSLCEALYHTGDWALLLTHFAWLARASRDDPARFPERSLLWLSKWAVRTTFDLPQVTRAAVGELLDDMEARFRRAGASLRPVFQHRAFFALEIGDTAALKEHAEAYWRSPRDATSDCPVCEHSHRAELLDGLGRHAEALQERLRLLESRRRCAFVPDVTHSEVLPALLRTGDTDRAKHHHRAGYARVRSRARLSAAQGRHLGFAAARGRTAEVLELLACHLPSALRRSTPGERFEFLGQARLATEHLEEAGVDAIPIPSAVAEDGREAVPPAELRTWLDRDALPMARAFDERNGSTRRGDTYRAAWRVWGR